MNVPKIDDKVLAISEKYDKAYLDASLPAAALYEKPGFFTIKHERYPVELIMTEENLFLK